jgi:hypothetical protein
VFGCVFGVCVFGCDVNRMFGNIGCDAFGCVVNDVFGGGTECASAKQLYSVEIVDADMFVGVVNDVFG